MTAQQLIQSVLRYMGRTDAADCSAQELAELQQALNAALLAWYERLPALEKTMSVNPVLRAPASVQIDILQYARAFTLLGSQTSWLATHMEEAVGSSCFVAGDAQRNHLTGAGTLARAFLGTATGNETLSVYFDAAQMPEQFEQITNRPAIVHGSTRRILNPVSPEEIHDLLPSEGFVRQGTPEFYCVEPLNTLGGETPSWIVRVHPPPSADMTLEIVVSKSAPLVTLPQLLGPHDLAASDAEISTAVRPMLIRNMADAGLVDREKFDLATLRQNGIIAEARSSRTQTSALPVIVGTPRNW